MPTITRKTAKKVAGSSTAKKISVSEAAANPAALAPIVAPGSPETFRVRVRMYRHGLGDCFLITFPREGKDPFQILIDCGALARDAQFMTRIVEHIRDTVRNGKTTGKARLDVVVGTHEHKDHLSGFNQARQVFTDDFDIGAVWLGWTENLTQPDIKKIKETRKKAIKAIADLKNAAEAKSFEGIDVLPNFSQDDDNTGSGKVADALEYLKLRGEEAGNLHYLEPGTVPFNNLVDVDSADGVRVYVLGPPRDPILLKGSEVTEQMKQNGVIYHLSRTGEASMDALIAALDCSTDEVKNRYHPFSVQHRIPLNPDVSKTYNDSAQAWRRIDHDWFSAFGQLALDLDSDTNNTSLVLAFEFRKTREVLLFVGDAQVGSWQSWAKLEFNIPDEQPVPAHDLLRRTVFYKVGHHCSHNATLRNGGLELMNRDDLVAFIPLDLDTAKKQGKKGWEMPAPPLLEALREKAGERVVISDVKKDLTTEAKTAGIIATDTYIDYFL